jgi:hypothetical protein
MDYILSPDGAVVYRLTTQQTIPASTLDTALLPASYSVTLGSSGSPSVTTYNAGYDGGGGGQITALYGLGAPLPTGDVLQWVQVVNTNDPANGATSPYLDNAANPSQPFYSYTSENRDPNLPANQLNFYDYSRRPPGDVSATNSVNWSANLYPALWNTSTNALTVENGVSWGWTAMDAMVGTESATFQNPAPSTATVTGVGTSDFTWGTGDGVDGGSPSELVFTGNNFSATPNQPFDLGTLTYYNGSNTNDATSVDFDISINLTNVPEKNFTLNTPITLINTPNTSDPVASADTVSLGNFGYAFHVDEGDTASVEVFATLSTNLTGTPSGVKEDSLYSSTDTLGSNPTYALDIVGLENPSSGGFVTTLNIEGTEGGQTVIDGGMISLFRNVTIVDSTTGLNQTLSVTLSNPADGQLSNLDGGNYNATTGVYTITGTQSDVTSALDELVFTPTPGEVAPGATITTTFTIVDSDADGSSATDSGTSVVTSAPCYAAGTLILTERGEIPVEQLDTDDRVITFSGRVVAIRWVGHRHVDCVSHPRPRQVWPVRVAAGAFGPGTPRRDLWLSPDHAVYVATALVPIRYLINDKSIVQTPVDRVTYYHIELPKHDIVLAERLPAESYLDVSDRNNFTNGGGEIRLFPDFAARNRDVCALWDAYGCAPLIIAGRQVATIRQRLEKRARLVCPKEGNGTSAKAPKATLPRQTHRA